LAQDESNDLDSPFFRFKWLHLPVVEGDAPDDAGATPFYMGGEGVNTGPAKDSGEVPTEDGWVDNTIPDLDPEAPPSEEPPPVPDPDGEGLLCWFVWFFIA
jgi:hypothetical protein